MTFRKVLEAIEKSPPLLAFQTHVIGQQHFIKILNIKGPFVQQILKS